MTRIIDEQFLSSTMALPEGDIKFLPPSSVQLTVLTVLVAIRIVTLVLMPEQFEGNPLFPEFKMDTLH